MGKIHILSTDKPSRLHLGNSGLILCDLIFNSGTINSQHIYITSDEEIKEGNAYITRNEEICKSHNGSKILLFKTDKKIILTTDSQLIADGVQAIDDDFLEWFVKNPSCEEVEVKLKQHFEADKSKRKNILNGVYYSYKIIIPKEETKQETIEAAAKKYADKWYKSSDDLSDFLIGVSRNSFEHGAKWQQERMYSEEEVEDLIYKVCGTVARLQGITLNGNHIDSAYRQFKIKIR